MEVIDRTGLSGTFDVTLDYFRPAAAIMAQTPSLERVFEPLGFVSFPKALEKQLGLKLEDATAPYDVIVIDRAQRPARVVAAAKQAPATQVPRRLVYKASDGVVLPVPLKRVEPEYPASAQQVRMQGTVVVTMVVLPDGTPDDVRATKPLDRLLDELAVRAAREWRFRPGTKDGQPVAVEVSIEMGFALRGPTYKAGVDGVSLPVPVKRVEPAYPEAEQNAGIQGVVTLEAVVLPDGTVGKTSVVAPLDPALDEQALQAMKQWQFKPGTKDGEAVPVRVAVEMSFRLR